MRGTHQHLVHGIKQEKAKTEMNDTVVMISIQVQPILHPKTSWNFRVGVMRADRMEGEENDNERVGKIGEPKFAIAKRNHNDTDEDQKVFEVTNRCDRADEWPARSRRRRNRQLQWAGNASRYRVHSNGGICCAPRSRLPNQLFCPHCRWRVRLSQRERVGENGGEGEPPCI